MEPLDSDNSREFCVSRGAMWATDMIKQCSVVQAALDAKDRVESGKSVVTTESILEANTKPKLEDVLELVMKCDAYLCGFCAQRFNTMIGIDNHFKNMHPDKHRYSFRLEQEDQEGFLIVKVLSKQQGIHQKQHMAEEVGDIEQESMENRTGANPRSSQEVDASKSSDWTAIAAQDPESSLEDNNGSSSDAVSSSQEVDASKSSDWTAIAAQDPESSLEDNNGSSSDAVSSSQEVDASKSSDWTAIAAQDPESSLEDNNGSSSDADEKSDSNLAGELNDEECQEIETTCTCKKCSLHFQSLLAMLKHDCL